MEPKHQIGDLVYHPQHLVGTIMEVIQQTKRYLYRVKWSNEESITVNEVFTGEEVDTLKRWLNMKMGWEDTVVRYPDDNKEHKSKVKE
jgi:hypothetical protein